MPSHAHMSHGTGHRRQPLPALADAALMASVCPNPLCTPSPPPQTPYLVVVHAVRLAALARGTRRAPLQPQRRAACQRRGRHVRPCGRHVPRALARAAPLRRRHRRRRHRQRGAASPRAARARVERVRTRGAARDAPGAAAQVGRVAGRARALAVGARGHRDVRVPCVLVLLGVRFRNGRQHQLALVAAMEGQGDEGQGASTRARLGWSGRPGKGRLGSQRSTWRAAVLCRAVRADVCHTAVLCTKAPATPQRPRRTGLPARASPVAVAVQDESHVHTAAAAAHDAHTAVDGAAFMR
jgi:hypothetical protein